MLNMIKGAFYDEIVNLIRPFHIFQVSNIKKLEKIMAKTKAQKQEDYIECLKAKDLLTQYLNKQERRKNQNN